MRGEQHVDQRRSQPGRHTPAAMTKPNDLVVPDDEAEALRQQLVLLDRREMLPEKRESPAAVTMAPASARPMVTSSTARLSASSRPKIVTAGMPTRPLDPPVKSGVSKQQRAA